MVLLAWETDCSRRPIDGRGSEDGGIGLATAQMPEKLVEGPFLGVLLTVNDLEVLFFSDCFLFSVPDFRPLAARDDRDGKVAHIESEVVEASQENVG